ncbi:MAG: carotenoid oxygenase family protein, partial [Chloroflexota bacterium]
WQPELGTMLAVIDRASGECRWVRGDAFMMFHTINAFDGDTGVVLDVCAYEDGRVVAALGDVMEGRWQPLDVIPTRLEVDLARNTVRVGRLGDRSLEFPRVGHRALTAEHHLFFGVAPTEDDPRGFLTQPAKCNLRTGATGIYPLPAGHYAGEPVFVPAAGAAAQDDGYLLTLVLDSVAGHSYLAVFNASDTRAPAIATARLPHAVPFGFHGNFVPNELAPQAMAG